MLEKIELRNFQAHERLTIDCTEPITTILGPTDVGKSSIARAIKWAVTNKPGGEDFKRHGKKRVGVLLRVDGSTIQRDRGKGNNYQLDEQKFVSFGNEVPEPISEFLGMDEVNFQSQLEPPFWFDLTAGRLASELNAIVNLSDIDIAISEVNGKLRQSTTQLEIVSARVESANTRIQELEWVEQASEDHAHVEELKQRLDEVRETLGSFRALVESARAAKARYDSSRGGPEEIEEVIELGKRALDLKKTRDEYWKLLEARDLLKRKLERLQTNLEDVNAELDSVEVCPLCEQQL